ncbi:MAG: TatD family deoxyribonuclease [Clostridiales bacterium]|nr:TatD family deoxyribonuclease [Clostridiales bacterium]
MYIDTHCHLHDEKLSDTDNVVNGYLENGVSVVLNMACCALTANKGKELAEKYPSVYFGSGCHPCDTLGFDEKEFDEIKKLTSHEKCVAVGEIGLDYYHQPYDKNKQIDTFIKQIELAKEVKLPISIHSRDATGDMVRLLKENKSKLTYGGVMHCYSGSVETARELLNLGLYISFAGPLTFKNANTILDVAKYVPNDMCLTETDSPYLSPHPLRGKINTPKNIPLIVKKLAEIKDVSEKDLASQIMQNGKRLFYKIK